MMNLSYLSHFFEFWFDSLPTGSIESKLFILLRPYEKSGINSISANGDLELYSLIFSLYLHIVILSLTNVDGNFIVIKYHDG
jgi:hypothetical protein